MSLLRRLLGLDDKLGKLEWSRWSENDAERAPRAKLRVCAYHIDFDEQPRFYVDVDTLEQAKKICDELGALKPGNVDYAVAYDDKGERMAKGPW